MIHLEVKLLYTEIVSELESKINNNEIKEGEKLPSERELASHYDVSRSVIREALGVLRENGLVTVHAGRGAYATKPNPIMITDSFERIMKYYNTSIEEILEVREELEKIIVLKVVHAATEEDIKQMYAIYNEMEDCKYKLEEFTKLDEELHKQLAKSTNNPIYHLLLSSFIDMTQKILFQITFMFPHSSKEAQEQHLALIKAIENRDETEAEKIIVDHMEVIRSEIKILREKDLI